MSDKFQEKAKKLAVEHANKRKEKTDVDFPQLTVEDVYVVWFCKMFQNWKVSLPVVTEIFAVSFTVLTKKAVYLMPGANISKMISGWKHLRRKGSILLSIRPDTEAMTKSFHGILYPAA